jgi:phage antirepressor YoqD-like protein
MNEEKSLMLKKLLSELTRSELENQFLEKTIELNEITEQTKELKNQLIRIQPKADFHDAVTESDDLTEMSAVAKTLNFSGIGRNKLFEFLRNKGVLRHNNEPYQEYVNRGYFKIVEQSFQNAYGDNMINRKTMVFQKGLVFIHKILLEAGYELNNQ